jgi:hypothetical protein
LAELWKARRPAKREVASRIGNTSLTQPPNWAAIGVKTKAVASPLSRALPASAVAWDAPCAETSIHEVNAKKPVTTATDR